MAKIKQRWLLRINSMIASILAIMGITSCESGIILPGGDNIECKYGIPYSSVMASGEVTNEEHMPIEGIQVTYQARNGFADAAPVMTDKDGHFTISAWQEFNPKEGVVYFTDIDGESNGAYQDDSIVVSLSYPNTNDAWDMGTSELKDVNITLKKK